MKIEKKIVIHAPIESVWKIFATDFNDAQAWMATVYKSYERPDGGGRTCELSTKANGPCADEVINNINEENHSLAFSATLQNAGPLPVKENHITVSMKKQGENDTEVTWADEPSLNTAGKVISPIFKLALGIIFARVLEDLKHYAETGEPHPRKVKALATTKR